jgi:putative intracellular protease/amidase
MSADDHRNHARNLRWILARERARTPGDPAPRVGVLADAGAWHVGARSIVDALERDGVACRALDASLATPEGLAGLEAVVLPGGWAGLQDAALGAAGGKAVRAFVEGGGTCLAVCAGAFLASKTEWQGKAYAYGVGLYDGTATGPIATLAPWPRRAPVRLAVTEAGKRRGLFALATRDVLYYGGPRLLGAAEAEILAIYPDGTAAAVARRVGKGEVVLVGPHVERPAPAEGGDDAPAPASAGATLRALLRLR